MVAPELALYEPREKSLYFSLADQEGFMDEVPPH